MGSREERRASGDVKESGVGFRWGGWGGDWMLFHLVRRVGVLVMRGLENGGIGGWKEGVGGLGTRLLGDGGMAGWHGT